MFRFVQFDLPGVLGPPAGRYLLRRHAGEEPHHVLVIGDLSGRPAWAGARTERRARSAAPEPPPPDVPATRVTLIDTDRPADEDAAHAWLRSLSDRERAETVAAEALGHVDTALHAYRVAAADPRPAAVRRADALAARAGYGLGEQVAEGRWAAAVTLPGEPESRRLRRRDRENALRPQERLAALLSGRDAVLACETLVLRARSDVDAGREREAALQVHLSVEAAVAELAAWRDLSAVRDRLSDLEALRDEAAAAANAALRGGLEPDVADRVREIVEHVEALLRARSASALF